MSGSGPGVGFEYPPNEVSWLKRDALLFANSIGCTFNELHFLYVRNALESRRQVKGLIGLAHIATGTRP